jgi:monoterpene epsilon-lactone hydrolase
MLRTMRLFLWAYFATLRARLANGPRMASWPFGFEVVVRYLRRDWESTADWDFARLRADMDRRPYPKNAVKKVSVRDATLGGVPARSFAPPEARHAGVVLFFHGGSYIYGSVRSTHAELLASLTLASGTKVVGPDYRLAPEHPYPAQLENALAAFDALVASGTPAGAIVLAGDSAGGNLALATAIALRDRGGAQPCALVLLSPWSDLAMPGASFRNNDRFDYGTREVLVRHARAFAGSVPVDDPRVSCVHAALGGLPPSLVVFGACEIPHDDIVSLADALEAAGTKVTRHEAPDMPHNPAVFAAYHPSGMGALEAMARFVEERLDADRLPSSRA